MDIFVFGYQAANCQPFFEKIWNQKRSCVLETFFEDVCRALRTEIYSVAQLGQQYQFPSFSNIQELLDRYYQSGHQNPAMESSILCLLQLANLIMYLEVEPGNYLNSTRDTHMLGLCSGLLAATAAASAGSLTDLLPLAVEAVTIAFRVGAYVGSVSDLFEPRREMPGSWSSMISAPNLDQVANELREFHQENQIPPLSRIWISAVSPSSVTISGPPSVQDRLFDTNMYFKKSNRGEIAIYGPYHARHLHSAAGVESIITPRAREVYGHSRLYFKVHSNFTGKEFAAADPLQLLRECLKEMLLQPFHWDKVLDELSSAVSASITAQHIIRSVGPNTSANSLLSTLRNTGATAVSIEELSTVKSWRPSGRSNPSGNTHSGIAIVGMAGRFPDAADLEKFWELLENGLDVHREVPKDRFDVKTHYDPTSKQKNTTHTPYGCFIENPGLFDARFFNMSPREATQTDPMQRLMLTTAYEAMEMAGIVPGRTPSTKSERIGTFYGQTSDDWREINAAQDIDTYFISGGVRAFGPGRLNYYLKFSGPSFIIDTACSSSLAAIHLACTSLQAKECDTAFTGGANVLTNPDIFSGLSRGHFLSKTGSCKTFDNDADGYCRGDGVATVILKRMEDALADNDPILGVIRGWGTNHSADAISITHPHAGAQEFLFSKVLREAGVDAHSISYVEMHGTGTQAGDGVEMQSVTNVFAPVHRQRRDDQPLYLGSLKANIGHGEAVSGVNSLIKLLLMLQKDIIPPHCGIKGILNKSFPKDLKERKVNIALEKKQFLRPLGRARSVFLNNFSAAGGNTALLLEDPPERKQTIAEDQRPTHIIAVSAKSLAAIRNNIRRLRSHISKTDDLHLPSLSYTSTARRMHYNYRAIFAVKSVEELKTAMIGKEHEPYAPVPMVSPQVAFVFTGQGSQYSSLGKSVYETSSRFRRDLEQFNQVAESQGFPPFLGLVDGSIDDISSLSPLIVQLGTTCVQIALARLWISWNVQPSVLIGHSLGEYAALHIAGVLSIADTIFLVGRRASLLEAHCTINSHAMLAVKASGSSVDDSADVEIACINGPEETVVAGTVAGIDQIASSLMAKNFKCTKVKVPFAFHSSQVDVILKKFISLGEAVTFHAPQIPLLSPLLSAVIRDDGILGPSYLTEHCRKPVNFLGALDAALQDGIIDKQTIWVEIGAHPVCSGMIKSTLSQSVATVPSLRRGEDAWTTISKSASTLYLGGVPLDWAAYHQNFESSLNVVSFPTYGFDEKVYWLDYTNDWTLTKGDVPVSVTKPEKPKLTSTTIHQIIQEEVDKDTAKVVAESNLADPLLHTAVSGHLVNGAGLCPSSIYADMALTIANYAFKLLQPGTSQVGMNVRDMECPAPLILKNIHKSEDQLIHIETTVDLRTNEGVVVISSNHSRPNKTIHGKCLVTFEDTSRWISEWERRGFLVQSRISTLEEKIRAGAINRISRGMAYKLFSSLVEYSDKFRGMEEVILDGLGLEAVSKVAFQAGPEDGDFFLSPYWIDSLAHISGFIMNGGEGVDSKNQVYISHGWETMRFAMTLEAHLKYRAYVKMEPGAGKMVIGDVYVLDEQEKIIAVVGGLKFQCIPRTLLNTFLPPAGMTKIQPSIANTARAEIANQPQHVIKSAERQTVKTTTRQEEMTSTLHAKTQSSKPSELTAIALNIIATEIGVDSSELADAIRFADLGVDSLMSLTISGRFREELNLDVHSTLFVDFPSIGDIKLFLSQSNSRSPSESLASELSINSRNSSASSLDTIPDDLMDQTIKASDGTQLNSEKDEHEIIMLLRSTIAGEMGIDIEEIAETTDLSTIGMDSLMNLTILSVLREKTDLEFDNALLFNNPTIKDLRRALGIGQKAVPPPAMELSQVQAKVSKLQDRQPQATSILLQGNPRTATRNLFLFPDGSGSATSYVSIPPLIPADVCVYGMNCPFMKDPCSYTNGIDGVSKLYISEILRRQPQGPFILGGWSAGGVVAFEITRQLQAMAKVEPHKNYVVEKLILIDAPCPIRLEPLPSRLHHFFDQIGLLGTGNPSGTPDWLLPHFEYSIKALTAYKPEKLDPQADGPRALLIWARDGVCKNPSDPRPPPQDDDPKSMKWLLENRTDFSPNGWDKLLGSENCACISIPGNHFTLMRDPIAQELGAVMRAELQR